MVNQVLSGKRPKFGASETPSNVKRIIEACWSADPRKRPTADKIAYILTDLWTHHARRNQQRGADTRVIGESAASQIAGSLVDDALGPSKSAEEEDVVIELKEGEVTK